MWLGTPAVGSVVGDKYRLTRPLGGGGMSVVFAAENTVTNKQVALKFLLASLADRPDAKARLLREARASSRIKHRNVVDVYDVGFEGETMFLVMDLLEGETLATVLETTTMSIPALLRLVIPAMRGVAEAHRLGVIHRDIKPDNIFLAREVDHTEPVVTVLDFGVAKVEGDSLHTHSGSATGTPVFMSVEQIRGSRDLDARVDVYGFGVILYMALCGRLPVSADTLPELIYKLTSSAILPLSALRPELPAGLSELVARAMAREREDRTPTLEQLIRELTPFASGGDELGSTRQVRYGRDIEPMPATMPAIDLLDGEPSTPLPGPPSEAELARSQRALQTPVSSAPARKPRWPMALLGAGTLTLVLATMLGTRADTPVSTPSPPRAVAREPLAASIAPREELAPIAAAAVLAVDANTHDAGPAAPTALKSVAPALRLRKAVPVAVVVDAPAPPAAAPAPPAAAPARRRLASEDFFAAPKP